MSGRRPWPTVNSGNRDILVAVGTEPRAWSVAAAAAAAAAAASQSV